MSKRTEPDIPVVFGFDRHYASFAAVATFSVALHTKRRVKFIWLTFEQDRTAAEAAKAALAANGIEVQIEVVPPALLAGLRETGRFTRSVYLRFLTPLFAAGKKAIYLDSDVLVKGDIGTLFDTELGSKLVAGVRDDASPGSVIELPPGDPYINSGVLLFNLQRFKGWDYLPELSAVAKKWDDQIIYPDQCLLNKFAEGQKLVLDPAWNSLQKSKRAYDQAFAVAQPRQQILHYYTEIKPWMRHGRAASADLWWSYADQLNLPELQRYKTGPVKRLFHRLLRN